MEVICRKERGAFKYILEERLKFSMEWKLTEVEKHLLREECQTEASFAVQREEVGAEWNTNSSEMLLG